MRNELTAARLRELLHYNPETGVFTWRTDRRSASGGAIMARAGDQAGCITRPHGYRYIGVDGCSYRAARLAVLYMTGSWPPDQVDHIDRNRANEAWANLRPCNNAENSRNRGMRADNTSGFPGVTWHKAKKRWQAQIKRDGVNHVLGRRKDPLEAYLLYKKAAAE